MKLYMTLFALLFSLFCTPSVSGQNKPCNNSACAYLKAENFLKQAAYQKALDNLDSAEGYLTDTNTKEKEQIKQLRRRLFVAIEKEKEDAKRARDEAKRQTKIAKNALVQMEIEKETAVAAEKKVKAVLDKIYFYDDKFGLAYDKENDNYGFIDKDLNTKIKFKYWKASPFGAWVNGFAKVEEPMIQYLIDTTGKEYPLTTSINTLNTDITAFNLQSQNIEIIPTQIFDFKNIVILLLDANKLTTLPDSIVKFTKLQYLTLKSNRLQYLPVEIGKLINLRHLDLTYNKLVNFPIVLGGLVNLQHLNLGNNKLIKIPVEIGKLTNLRYLNLSSNQLVNLPIELGDLVNLQRLDLDNNQLKNLPVELEKLKNLRTIVLWNNQISKEEQEKIRKLLPNCEIEF